jgi:methyl-galactoside transport system permease protein
MSGERMVSRSGFSIGLIVIGVLFAVLGTILWFMGVGAESVFDLFLFVSIIGIGLILFGVRSFMLSAKEPNLDLSNANLKKMLLDQSIIIALMLILIIIAVIAPRFLQLDVLVDILTQSSTKLIIALGICMTLMIGGTDLSAGRMVGLAAVVSGSMVQTVDYSRRFFPDLPQLPIILPVVIAILACCIFGLLNGILIAKFNEAPFIATLATQVIVYGACSLYFDMKPNSSQPIGGIRPDFSWLGQHLLFGSIPILIPIAILFAIGMWFLLNKTVFGKNIYAIGGNRQAAVVSGINVPLTLVLIFVIAAGMYGVGGVLEAARTAGATNNYGFGYELDAIAACVVGGVSLNGGVGKVSGIVIGVLIFTVIAYGLTFTGLPPQGQQISKGVIIAVAVALDVIKYNKK